MDAKRAAEAHSTLNTFAAIIAILEGGCTIAADAYPTAEKIIKLCKRAQRHQLYYYDRNCK
jgi:hypothetical protein